MCIDRSQTAFDRDQFRAVEKLVPVKFGISIVARILSLLVAFDQAEIWKITNRRVNDRCGCDVKTIQVRAVVTGRRRWNL